MSLHNSDFTYFTLQEAGPAAFKSEVDRYVKEVDLFRSDAQTDERPRKRARYADSQSQESGYGSHPHPSQPPQTVSGVILEVSLVNFLSHEEFKITLNKRLNFIVGLNGSGKSAILTGIIVALGGTASMTGRGTSLKDFVKHNCQSARVTVVVNNTGSLNYYREQYGNKITVIRTIDNQGRSKVELRTEGGRTISTKMEDLRGMCLKLGIQVDNPVSVLDQSTAKTLLRENKPAELFRVFMKATDLETLRDLHDEIERLCRQTDQEIRKKKRDLQNNNAELVEIKRKYELVESLEEDKVKEDVLKLELLRAQARDSLMELREAQRALKNAQTERLELEKLLSSDHESQTLLQALEDIKQEGMDLAIQREEMESNFKTLNTKVNDTTKELKRCGLDKEELETRIQHNNFMIGEFKNEIDSLEKKLQPCLLEEKKKMEEELSLLQQTLKQCENDQLAFKTKLQNLYESLSHSNDALVEIRGDERRLQKSLVEKERELQNLKTDSTNLSRFGGMKRLVELIEQNAGNFKRKPIGPLGAFVKVKDPKWILAVEAAIRPRINNFLLEHKEDEKLLQSLVRTVGGPKPGVVRCRFIPPINTSMREARTSNYSNVLDMIEVNDPNVRNALIEIFTVEGILLIPTDDECHNLLKDRRNVPKNCFKAITLKGSSYFPDPHYRTYGAIHDEARFLAVSQESIITGVSNTIARIQNELMEIKQKCSSATLEVQNTKKLIKEAKTADRTNSENLIEAKNKMEKLRDSENFDTHSIHTLKEDLAERMRRQTENNALLEKYNEKLQNLKKEQRELKRKGTEFQNKINELEKLRSPLITKQAKIKEKIEKINCFKTNSANKIKQIKNQEEQHACTFKKSEDAFNQRNQDAEKFASHLASDGRNLQEIPNTESSRNTKTIDDDLKRIMKKRASLEKSLGNNWHEISRSYHDTFAVHAGIQKKIETLQKNSLLLKEALESRQNLYLIQRKFTGCVVSHQFTRVLFQRNCIGNVKVNFEKKLLDINVGPIDQGDRAGLGTSSLSGGERSYATAAFVIALWIVTELPFYYLDEFDVFMDKVARQTVLNLLLKFARMKRGYQFGILTPQDTAAISQAADLTIFKLANPRDDI